MRLFFEVIFKTLKGCFGDFLRLFSKAKNNLKKIDLTSENKNNFQGYFLPQKILREGRKVSKIFATLFDDILTFFDVAPFRWPLLRSADQSEASKQNRFLLPQENDDSCESTLEECETARSYTAIQVRSPSPQSCSSEKNLFGTVWKMSRIFRAAIFPGNCRPKIGKKIRQNFVAFSPISYKNFARTSLWGNAGSTTYKYGQFLANVVCSSPMSLIACSHLRFSVAKKNLAPLQNRTTHKQEK